MTIYTVITFYNCSCPKNITFLSVKRNDCVQKRYEYFSHVFENLFKIKCLSFLLQVCDFSRSVTIWVEPGNFLSFLKANFIFETKRRDFSSSQVCFPMLLFLALTFNSKQSPFSHENDKSGKDCQEMEIMRVPFFVYGNDRQLS